MLVSVMLPVSFCQSLNILFILADDVGWNDISLHGGSKWQTPNIDSIAHNGIELKKYYVQPVCSPSRASLLTGRHVIHTGVYQALVSDRRPFQYLDTTFKLLPEYLKLANYSTHLVGKWHLGYSCEKCVPLARGFDTFTGFYSAAEGYTSHSVKPVLDGAKGRTVYDFLTGTANARTATRPALEYNGTASNSIFTNLTLNLLQKHRFGKENPFFILLSTQAVHSPYVESQNLTEWEFCGKVTKEFSRQSVCSMMLEMDRAVGTILDTLKLQGLMNDTIVIFSSDNGGPNSGWENGSSNFPLRGGKSSLFEGGVRSIGLLQGPPHIINAKGKGHQHLGLFHITDWLPTLLDFVSFNYSALNLMYGDGISQAIAIRTVDAPNPRNWVLLETRPVSAENCVGGLSSPSSCTGWPFPFYHGKGIIIDDMKLVRNIIVPPYGVYRNDGGVDFYKSPGGLDVNTKINGWETESPPSSASTVLCPGASNKNDSFIAHQCRDNWCLFNLTADPCEHHDLAQDRNQVAKISELERLLEQFSQTAVLGPSQGTCEPIEQHITPQGSIIYIFGPCE